MSSARFHTVELCEGNPCDYLVAQAPGEWMPWNYQRALAAEDAPSAN